MQHRRQREAEHDRLLTDAARLLNRSALVLAGSVLADSGVEHYRGTLHNRAMVAPLIASTLSVLASVHGHADDTPERHRLRDAVHVASAAVGVAGSAFHVYNVTKRPGGFSWHNLFYGAPLGAPFALLLSGMLGVAGERLRACPADAPRLAGLPGGRALAGLVAAGLVGTLGEVGLLHFRGAFQHRAMFVPLVVPPVAALAAAQIALSRPRGERPFCRWWMRATAVLGCVGVAFHARGIARQMGGWRNWSQNVLSGPPLPAPPSFTALAIAGLAATALAEREAR
ncbi:hypothetical protein QZM46_22375 [Burkholderia vietnamiensis]|uniref:hypothetical protein n=1 Tax=Burkholderia vietnamiensis TaxID=60552 RepID=UPI001593C4A7|nr:hypothetical protein [Burkholderia vietnamiensis]MDN7554066.1 hypothetical protein [Burkholderia vietnamiensis]HDR9009501.1 hypothetical protein [Burkholderia vietnamiensis]HDR9015726.1 hypothetical protein [Burkholderia vietnamiensis]HDR9091589.1 hypothetical protein [Burkholderia vietnamiensis]HDR9105836.1 hypothetical protein [Burkholderia vietnamiensis]